ncbi:hypothetical protein BRADI_4g10353v3 [Brachypodium distachyon]|uniref:Uncharacterized protein n=1 Tax=Brachypodium distachyon TaxID=15368 RepID=A0A2K2CLU4_BRADI|nr:hypothetical protein BRADI_4g10353v3 [Brachypodium distachyon]
MTSDRKFVKVESCDMMVVHRPRVHAKWNTDRVYRWAVAAAVGLACKVHRDLNPGNSSWIVI